jgi:tRNA pseudouridine38-40 synthase
MTSLHILRACHYRISLSVAKSIDQRPLAGVFQSRLFAFAIRLSPTTLRYYSTTTATATATATIMENETKTNDSDTKAAVDKTESDKRPLPPSSASKKEQPRNKKSRKGKDRGKDKGNFHKAYDVDVDDRERPPQEGSFASPAMRELFGVTLDDKKITLAEDQATVKRKVALMLGFLGTKYGGFQANPNQRTIQAEVELALYRAGLIGQYNFGQSSKYSFSMSARTDKGVHACAQVCSLKVQLLDTDIDNLEGVRQRVEERLPEDIRLLDIQRTIRAFCAKTQRDRVRYQYMIPSFLLHPDYRSVLKELDIPMEGRHEVAKLPLSKEEVAKLKDVLKDYRSTEEQRSLLQSALAKYEGTHPFHNFTKGIKRGEAQANRFIESFKAQDPVIIDGIEWIPTQVLGQSFLLHQIRKMVSMAVDVARGVAPASVLDRALSKTDSVRVHVAPAQGLFLEMSYFTGYNRRKQSNPDLIDLDWTVEGPANERWSAFRDKIREHIVEEEKEEGNFVQYFYIQECIFQYRRFYRLDGNTADDFGEDGSGDES